jgi:hypothetical protein
MLHLVGVAYDIGPNIVTNSRRLEIARVLHTRKGMALNSDNNLVRALMLGLGLLVVFGLVWFDSKYGMVFFAYPSLNYAVFILAMLIPSFLMAFTLKLPRIWMKALGAMILLPLVLISGLWGSLAALALPLVVLTNATPFLSKDKTIETANWNLTYYHGDGYVIVYQEKPIGPDLILTREIYHSGGPDPVIEVLDNDTIKLIAQPGMYNQSDLEIRLKRYVYF